MSQEPEGTLVSRTLIPQDHKTQFGLLKRLPLSEAQFEEFLRVLAKESQADNDNADGAGECVRQGAELERKEHE